MFQQLGLSGPAETTTLVFDMNRPTNRVEQGAGCSSHPGCVLIVDDEVVIRSLLSELLSEDGFTVATAEDGKHGLEYVNSGHVDLVISDVHMPIMSGPELVTQLRKIDPQLPVIVLNSVPGSDLPKNMAGAATAFLNKPFNLQELRQTISEVRSRPAVTRQNA